MPPSDEYYKKKFVSIVNVLKAHSVKLRVSGIAIGGSRARRQQRLDSDEDIIICSANDPIKEVFYPELIQILEQNFPHWDVYSGENYNVVHMEDPKTSREFELVLRTEAEFDRQHGNDIKYRRRNL